MVKISSPRILAINTTGADCAVALLIGSTSETRHVVAPMQQAQLILPMIHDLIAASSIRLADLDAIAYGCGPGNFTGIRIANSVAQGLGYALNKPLIPLSSLALLAQSAALNINGKYIYTAFDARMGRLYWGAYQTNDAGLVAVVGQEQLIYPNECVLTTFKEAHGVGDAWQVYPELARDHIIINPDVTVSPQAMLILALEKFSKQEWVTAQDAAPVYLSTNYR